MKPVPIPVFDGNPVVIPPDDFSRRIHEGVKSGMLAGARRELEAQVRDLERKLPATPRRNRAGVKGDQGGPVSRNSAALRPLTAAEALYVSPHRHTATGARNSAADLALIQQAHNAIRDLGATCTVTPDSTTDVEDADDAQGPEDMQRSAYRSAPSRISKGRISRR